MRAYVEGNRIRLEIRSLQARPHQGAGAFESTVMLPAGRWIQVLDTTEGKPGVRRYTTRADPGAALWVKVDILR
jgi:hypothetical protein